MSDDKWVPSAFILEEIQVFFQHDPLLSKKPGAPDGFIWHEGRHTVQAVLRSWFSFGRRARMEKNMRPTHLETAARRGSWGVGRYYFRVRIEDGRVFDLYYDRAPKDADDRSGHWFIWRELTEM
jgi:hypothetical protein